MPRHQQYLQPRPHGQERRLQQTCQDTSHAQIQEIVDENREDMPTGVATAIMQSCQDAYHALPKLYKIDTVRVVIQSSELVNYSETIFVEQCSEAEWMDLTYRNCTNFSSVMHSRKMPESALRWKLPFVQSRVLGNKVLENVILVSISPYGKRLRE